MSLSYDTLREMPRLRSYAEAKAHHDRVVPIRRRAHDNRPLGKRQHYYYIWEDAGQGQTIYTIKQTNKNHNNATDFMPRVSTSLSMVPATNTHYHHGGLYYHYEHAGETPIRYPKGTIHIGYGVGPIAERAPLVSYLPTGVIRIHAGQIGWSYNMHTLSLSEREMIGEVFGIRLQTADANTWATCTYYDPDTHEKRTGQLPIGRSPILGRRPTTEEALKFFKQGLTTADFVPAEYAGPPVFINPVFPVQYKLNRVAMANKLAPLKPLFTYIRGLQCLQDTPVLSFDDYMYEDFDLMREVATPAPLKRIVTRVKVDARELVTTALAACNMEGDMQARELLRASMMCSLYANMPTHEALRHAIKHHYHKQVFDVVLRTDGNVLKCTNRRFITVK